MKPLVVRASFLPGLSVALFCVAGVASSETMTPAGTAKPAEQDCSGLEGAALTSCRQLDAASGGGALVMPDAALSSAHDCARINGAPPAACRDLEEATPPPESGGTSATESAPGNAEQAPAATDSSLPANSAPRTVPGSGQGVRPNGRIAP
jgi:hypothetical protein